MSPGSENPKTGRERLVSGRIQSDTSGMPTLPHRVLESCREFCRPRHGLRRAGAVALCLGVLVTVAAMHDPAPSEAAPTLSGAARGQTLAPPDPNPLDVDPPLGPYVGEMISGAFRIEVFAGADGPRYTVRTTDGRLLHRGLEADEVYRTVPGLELRDLLSISGESSTSPMMLAPEPNNPW